MPPDGAPHRWWIEMFEIASPSPRVAFASGHTEIRTTQITHRFVFVLSVPRRGFRTAIASADTHGT